MKWYGWLILCLSIVGVLIGARLVMNTMLPGEPVAVSRVRITLEPTNLNTPTGWRSLWQWTRLKAGGVIRPEPGTTFTVTAYSYSSTVNQTDLSPCITASGEKVRSGIIAANFLPFGTRLKINDKEYVVEDRMNTRYNPPPYYIDIWHPTTEEALAFGKQRLQIEVLPIESAPPLLASPTPTPPPDFIQTLRQFGTQFAQLLSIRVVTPAADCL